MYLSTQKMEDFQTSLECKRRIMLMKIKYLYFERIHYTRGHPLQPPTLQWFGTVHLNNLHTVQIYLVVECSKPTYASFEIHVPTRSHTRDFRKCADLLDWTFDKVRRTRNHWKGKMYQKMETFAVSAKEQLKADNHWTMIMFTYPSTYNLKWSSCLEHVKL